MTRGETWPRRKLKTSARLITDRAASSAWKVGLENVESWTGRLISRGGEFEGEGIAFESGDVLFGKLRPYLAKVWVADRCGSAVGDFLVVRPTSDLDPHFLAHHLLSPARIDEITSSAFGSKMPRANWESVRELELEIPEAGRQALVIDFLDRETAEIDAFIADQEELIGLLTERRAATITHAVTKGLDPSAPMKASGVEWLGEVPERWLVNRLSRCVRINEGQVDPERVPFADMILIAPNHVEAKTGRSGSFESAAAQGAESGKYLVRSGQVIYSKIRPGLAKVILAPFDCLCSADMYGLDARSDEELDNRFLRWLMLSQPFTDYAIDQSARVAMPKLNRETLGAAPVWYANIDEQRDIADYLDRETAELDATISDAREAIALSKERRAALISAAVTGKIDVRAVA